jgi:hypothetical protein
MNFTDTQEAMGKSVTQEMATEIVRIAQTRVVQVEGVQLTCYQVEGRPTLKKVKSTLGDGWCFDNLFFPTKVWFDFLHVARVFVAHLRSLELYEAEGQYYEICFGEWTGISEKVVWRMHRNAPKKDEEEMTSRLAKLLQQPPIIVDTE